MCQRTICQASTPPMHTPFQCPVPIFRSTLLILVALIDPKEASMCMVSVNAGVILSLAGGLWTRCLDLGLNRQGDGGCWAISSGLCEAAIVLSW